MQNLNDTVPLSAVVKAAAIRSYEDFTKVEATYNHFAVLVLDELSRQQLRLGGRNIILPIHQNTKTVPLPLDCKTITFIGIIDECGYKIPLQIKGKITDNPQQELCVEKCTECNEQKDVCEQLVTISNTSKSVIIDGGTYVNKVTKYLENGKYYLIKKTWAKNLTTNIISEITTTEYLTEFDINECGCIKGTQENIEKVKEHCYDCYCACYTPCRDSDLDIGGYKISYSQKLIYFDKNIPYEKIYIEYNGNLPIIDDEYQVPEVAFESMVYGIMVMANIGKRSVDLGRISLYKNEFKNAKGNMRIILGRIKIEDILQSVFKIPKFDLATRSYNRASYFCSTNTNSNSANSSNNTTFIPTPPQVIGKEVALLPYTSTGTGEDFIIHTLLLDKKIVGVFKDGQGFLPIGETTIFDTSKKQFKYFPLLGKIQFSIPFYGTEDAFIQYY